MTSSRWLVAAQVLVVVIAGAPAAGQPSADASNPATTTSSTSNGTEAPFPEGSRRQHLALHLGVFNNAAAVFALGGRDLDDGRNTFYGAFNYRYSITPSIDLALHAGHWLGQWTTPTSRTVELGSVFVGPGVRLNATSWAPEKRVTPYLQANIYFVQEQSYFVDGSRERVAANGIGVGFSGGLDVAVGRRVSIPIEAIYVTATGEGDLDNLSGFGLSWGVELSF